MAVMDITLYPDEPLLRKAEPFDQIGPEVAVLARDMLDTMETYEGVGLAGPQVGISKRIFVLCVPDGAPMCLVNPEILERDGSEEAEEGCLSLPHVYASVPRATAIRVRGFDEHGAPLDFEAHDFLARVIQHENDHLDGIVFPDRLDILSREATLRTWQDVRQGMAEIMQQR
jgi:peptide deformylase